MPGRTHFAIGPPIFTDPMGGPMPPVVGDNGSPGFFDITTEIKARTADLAWSRLHEVDDSFQLEWQASLRFASFEQTMDGTYDEAATGPGDVSYAANKRLEGDMVGLRIGVHGTYRFLERFSAGAGLGLTVLDGELSAESSLTPNGTMNMGDPGSFAGIEDDGRSGNIRDLEIRASWHSLDDTYRIWLGWEQSTWEEIGADLLRNYPGTTAPLRDRESVTFSAYKVGLSFLF